MQNSRFLLFFPHEAVLDADFRTQLTDVLSQARGAMTAESVVLHNRFYLDCPTRTASLLREGLADFYAHTPATPEQMLSSRAVGQPILSPERAQVALWLWLIEDETAHVVLLDDSAYQKGETERHLGKTGRHLEKTERHLGNSGSLPDFPASLLQDASTRMVHSERHALTVVTQCITPECPACDAYAQTVGAFRQHSALLRHLGGTLEADCHRTWLYVHDIDRNYADVVRARNDVFDAEGLTTDTHFIASTGIGGDAEEDGTLCTAEFFSILHLPRESVHYVSAPDFLNPTHEYGVAFERATALCPAPNAEPTSTQEGLLLISGTASIDRHGAVLHVGDVVRQADRLFENIRQLFLHSLLAAKDGDETCEPCEPTFYIVYLRHPADARTVEAYMREHFPTTPALITHAPVCRPDWLIEVETIYQRFSIF